MFIFPSPLTIVTNGWGQHGLCRIILIISHQRRLQRTAVLRTSPCGYEGEIWQQFDGGSMEASCYWWMQLWSAPNLRFRGFMRNTPAINSGRMNQ